ncbi:carbohydrate ABC transporter permease [Treponema primitia]|uniref:carbohydrate ABC transporter permease n=1 Tax=Treponema primitia TaxID=88058 RepID=UPI000255503F|nr:sugar ABC transporter permease [Treponema primitia]
MKTKSGTLDLKNSKLGYQLLIPASILIFAISIFPLLRGIGLGFMRYSIRRANAATFNGLDNFIQLLQDKEFYSTLGFSFFYAFAVVIISYVMGMCFALLLNRDIKFRGFFRAMILIPWIIPPVVASTNWTWLLNDQLGFINLVLRQWGLIDKPILFLADPILARITVCFTGAWKSFPFMTIVLLSGLQGIPDELYEAASIDGAGFFRAFRHITVPMLKPVTTISTVLMFIWTFNNFENIYLLTKGGPANATFILPILSYYTAFFRSQLGYASAISTLMLVVLLFMALFYMRALQGETKPKGGKKA